MTAIVRRVLAGARPGAIVLLHDGGGDRTQTIEALPRIVRALRARHYRLVTVPRLLHDDPPPRRQPSIAAGID
jgi:peptidoglycan/xylan/chitin deacetylase (PgdA/CDA1 family)